MSVLVVDKVHRFDCSQRDWYHLCSCILFLSDLYLIVSFLHSLYLLNSSLHHSHCIFSSLPFSSLYLLSIHLLIVSSSSHHLFSLFIFALLSISLSSHHPPPLHLQGAIDFGIVFVAALEENQTQSDLDVQTIEEMGRIRSDLQTIKGSFTPPSEGVVFFLWDNTYVQYARVHFIMENYVYYLFFPI